MDISSRWFKATAFTLVAGAVTARYVTKWKRSRSLARRLQAEQPGVLDGRYYVGLDLTDPHARNPRPCDVAILDAEMQCQFSQWAYSEQGASIVPDSVLGRAFVLATDGPQGLAGRQEATMRESERLIQRIVRVPAKTSYTLPPDGRPFSGYITGSVKLFHRLVTSGSRFRLLGMEGVPRRDVNLLEVFPGAAWRSLGETLLPPKKTREGRRTRLALLQNLGLQLPDEPLPTADQLDAAMAAWTAYCFSHDWVDTEGFPPWLDEAHGVIREGYIVQPSLAKRAPET